MRFDTKTRKYADNRKADWTFAVQVMKKIILITTLFAALAAGCSQKHTGPETLNHQSQSDVLNYLDQYQPTVRADDKTIMFSELVDTLAAQRVVFVGEQHNRYDHHLNQLALLRELHRRNPNISIGVEWFQRPAQKALNQYLQGRITETEMLKRSQYMSRWRYDYRMMRPILEYARKHQISVIALNADVDITRKIGRGGLEALSAEERQQIPADITPAPEEERAALKAIFEHHPEANRENFENFATVQRVWDLTMSESIMTQLDRSPSQQMVVFAGIGHLSKGIAIPRVIAEQKPDWGTQVVHSGEASKDQSGVADFFILSQPMQLPPIGKVGIWLDDAEGGALVKQVVKDSAAQKAGLKDGDVITALDSKPTEDSAALKILLSHHSPKDTVTLAIRRGDQTLEVAVTLD